MALLRVGQESTGKKSEVRSDGTPSVTQREVATYPRDSFISQSFQWPQTFDSTLAPSSGELGTERQAHRSDPHPEATGKGRPLRPTDQNPSKRAGVRRRQLRGPSHQQGQDTTTLPEKDTSHPLPQAWSLAHTETVQ